MDEAAKPYAEQEMRLKALEDEISQAEASLENDFAKFASAKLESDEAFEELFFEDKEGFIKQILALQNEFLKSLQAKVDEANTLRGKIGQAKAMDNIQAAAEAFDARNLGVSSDELLDFFSQDLPPREKAALESLEPSAFFTALFEKYQNAKGAEKEKNEGLPQRLNASSANVENDSDELLTQRF